MESSIITKMIFHQRDEDLQGDSSYLMDKAKFYNYGGYYTLESLESAHGISLNQT